ncbi:MAG: PepSY domain-containing protein [Isosphaeraceae bacterium]
MLILEPLYESSRRLCPSKLEYEIFVNARGGAILKTTKVSDSTTAAGKMISRAQAEQIALKAVRGGKVLVTVLEKNDNPPDWSVTCWH